MPLFHDEISTGGSIKAASRMLKEAGVRSVRVGVTHPVLSGNAVECLNEAQLDEVVVTDTIPISENQASALKGLKVLSTAYMFGDAIMRIHEGRSISEMMG